MQISFRVIRVAVALLLLASVASAAETRKPGGTAFLKSLVVPGWGQYDLGRRNSALAFLGTDLALVGGMLTLQSYGSSARDDYEALARAYAGVVGDHGHDFYVDVGNWMTVAEYNERRLQERNFDALYTSPADFWAWDTDAHRAQMENLRIKSDRSYNRVIYLVGGLVLNHIASAIHAGRLAARLHRNPEPTSLAPQELDWRLSVQPAPRSTGLQLCFVHNF